MSDIQRFPLSAFGAGDRELAAQGLTLLGRALMDGDEHADTAVAVSFVEDTWDAPSEFIESWPTTLRDEAEAGRLACPTLPTARCRLELRHRDRGGLPYWDPQEGRLGVDEHQLCVSMVRMCDRSDVDVRILGRINLSLVLTRRRPCSSRGCSTAKGPRDTRAPPVPAAAAGSTNARGDRRPARLERTQRLPRRERQSTMQECRIAA